ncbi:MAG: DUF2256 domain-containing protein [Phycisphaerales bacterium]|nr:DUF2256 domain-containing protein [Phycisphaerales bacterium]
MSLVRAVATDRASSAAFTRIIRCPRGPHQSSQEPAVPNQHLPTKPCAHCKRDFAWRKKWERDWERVKYCSKKCSAAGAAAARAEARK